MIRAPKSEGQPKPRLGRWRTAIMLVSCVLLTACGSGYFGEVEKDIILPGKRISVLMAEKVLRVDDDQAAKPITLPQPYANKTWPQVGGNPAHSLQHIAVGAAPNLVWQRSIGAGSSERAKIVATPIIANDHVFVVNAVGDISAFALTNGDRLWRRAADFADDDVPLFSGALAYANQVLYFGQGNGALSALDAQNGRVLWQIDAAGPIRGAPVVVGDRVIVMTIDNRAAAYATADGQLLWQHRGFDEAASVFGGASAAIAAPWALIPYTSGELYALRLGDGQTSWSDSLATARAVSGISGLAAIGSYPVVDQDIVFVSSLSGRMLAIDLETGARVWERSVGGENPPWLAGEMLFTITVSQQLVGLSRANGQVRWVTPLPKFEDPEERIDVIKYRGPVLASDRLLAVDSRGKVLSFSPYSGAFIGELQMRGRFFVPPVIAKGTVLLLSDEGVLSALR